MVDALDLGSSSGDRVGVQVSPLAPYRISRRLGLFCTQAFILVERNIRNNMKVTVEDISTVKKVLHIEVPKDQVVSELDKAYTELKKGAKVKGFRPGKAPKSVLKRLYKKDVQSDVTSRLIQESLVEALKETELNMIGSPNLEPPEIDEENDYAYDATIEISPDIEDIDFKGLSLEKTLYTITG